MDYAKKYWWLPAIVVPLAAAVIAIIPGLTKESSSGGGVYVSSPQFSTQFYVVSVNNITAELSKQAGQSFQNAEVQKQLNAAVELLSKGLYRQSLPLFQALEQQLKVPGIFTNLGVAYAGAGMVNEAAASYAQAIALDPAYQAAHFNMATVAQKQGNLKIAAEHLQVAKDFEGAAARLDNFNELGSNNTIVSAASIPLAKPVESMLADPADRDFFSVMAPDLPRDWLKVTLKNRSSAFGPTLAVYGPNKVGIRNTYSGNPADLELTFAAEPNKPHYIEVGQAGGTPGPYTITVEPMRLFDRYEPNDEINGARQVAAGSSTEANIMDPSDVDFFTFEARRSGELPVRIQNRGNLGPALAVYGPDKTTLKDTYSGDPADLQLLVTQQAGQRYFVRIGRAGGADNGPYTLHIP